MTKGVAPIAHLRKTRWLRFVKNRNALGWENCVGDSAEGDLGWVRCAFGGFVFGGGVARIARQATRS